MININWDNQEENILIFRTKYNKPNFGDIVEDAYQLLVEHGVDI